MRVEGEGCVHTLSGMICVIGALQVLIYKLINPFVRDQIGRIAGDTFGCSCELSPSGKDE